MVGVSDFQSKIIIDDRSVVRFVRLTKVIIDIVNDCNIFSVVVDLRRRSTHPRSVPVLYALQTVLVAVSQ